MDFDTPQAVALREAMLETRKVCLKRQADYHSALQQMLDSKGDADGVLIHRREGRAYAQALTEYLNATMAWLAYTDPRSMTANAQNDG